MLTIGIGVSRIRLSDWFARGASPAFAVTAVPEIDPGVAQGALTLLVGGVLVLLGRRQRD